MKMALRGNTMLIKDVDSVQFQIIKSWNKMKWSKASQLLSGIADLELLDKLATLVRLPPVIEARRNELHSIAEAVDKERMNPDPVPFFDYPVKMKLFKHQVRGANMALLVFGFVPPDGGVQG